MTGATGRRMHLVGPGDPLVVELEHRLGNLIGILSKFIVEKSYSQVTGNGHDELSIEAARSMCSYIMEEAFVLLGPRRTEELTREFEELIEDHFKEGK